MTLPNPKSRKESYLAKAAGVSGVEIPEAPESREEQYLAAIAEGGGGGGTSDFDQLTNRPKYNGTTMTSETNIPEVIDVNEYIIQNAGTPTTSTEGTVGQLLEDTTNGKLYICTAVTPGTDPDPDTYTWTEVGAGGGGTAGSQRLLTTDDYNWNSVNSSATGTLDCVAIWLLDPGQYYIDLNTSMAYSMVYKEDTRATYAGTFIVSPTNNGQKTIMFLNCFTGGYTYTVQSNGTRDSFTNLTPATSSGTSDTRAMSQNATTSMVYADPGTNHKVKIGGTGSSGNYSVNIGYASQTPNINAIGIGYGAKGFGNNGVSIGSNTQCNALNSVALGGGALANNKGEINITTDLTGTTTGFNDTNYRLIRGLYDGQEAHDAATKGQLDSIAIKNAGAPTTATVGTVGQLLQDTTNGKLYICTTVDTTDPNAPVYTWAEVGGGGSITPVQTPGASTTDVMSQNATTSMVYGDPSAKRKVKIGNSTSTNGNDTVTLGNSASTNLADSIAIGHSANSGSSAGIAIGTESTNDYSAFNSVAIGYGSHATQQGQFDISTGGYTTSGYNSSNYRLITGVYDGQSDHDAATYGQLNTRLGGFTLLQITQTDYDALTTKDPNTLYIIVGA